MAITRERKEELVARYGDLLSRTDGFIVTEYKGMTVAQMNALRAQLAAAAGGTYTITKNTLFAIALRENGWVVPEELLVGSTAVAFGNGNLPAIAKAVQTYQKDNAERFVIKGGVLANSIFRGEDIEAVANLPTIEEIRAQLAGLIVQPASSLAGILNSATAQIVNVIQAYVNDREPGGENAAA